MKARRGYRQPGQSTILLAFLIVIIIGMIGLAVDVGNAFGQQRRVQSVTNASALAGMSTALEGNATNAQVWKDVQRVLTGNRVDAGPSYSYTVDYITQSENVVRLGDWNGTVETLKNPTGSPPAALVRMQVTMTQRIPTYFASVLGQDRFTVNANAVACMGDYGAGVLPLGVPIAKIPSSKGTTVRMLVANGNEFVSGVHVSWLNWGGATQTVDGKTYTGISGKTGASDLAAAFSVPGTLQDGFMEAASPDASKPNTKPIGKLQRGDWISGVPGVIASLEKELQDLKNAKTKIMLPMYDLSADDSSGSKIAYRMSNIGRFVVGDFDLTGTVKFIDLQYLGYGASAPKVCGSEASPTSSDKRFNISGKTNVQRVYRQLTSNSTTTYDIVLVMDTTLSMNSDWNDRQPGQSGYLASNARINDAKRVLTDFVQKFDLTSSTGDPDARIAFVTFGGTAPGKYDPSLGITPVGFNPVVVQEGWATACAADQIADDCGISSTLKWPMIQTKVAAMTPRGVTPGPIAFEEVENLLKSKRTPPPGKKYEQIVIFATDGVFNVCGSTPGTRSCPYGDVVPSDSSESASSSLEYRLYNAGYNAISGRPIWQAQQVANRIKSSGARVFVVSLSPTCLAGSTTCFDPAGLPEMSSGTGYYYNAKDKNAVSDIFATIQQKIVYDTCIPREVTDVAPGATVILQKPENSTFTLKTTTDPSGSFAFQNLTPGEYVIRIEPALTLASKEDGLSRTYSRLRNNLNLAEETQASVYINPQFPNGATEYASLLLSLPTGTGNAPNNGCTTPAVP